MATDLAKFGDKGAKESGLDNAAQGAQGARYGDLGNCDGQVGFSKIFNISSNKHLMGIFLRS